MKKYKRKLIPTNPMNIPAFESWLEDMAQEGLFLVSLNGYGGKFRQGEPKKMTYRLEIPKYFDTKPPKKMEEIKAENRLGTGHPFGVSKALQKAFFHQKNLFILCDCCFPRRQCGYCTVIYPSAGRTFDDGRNRCSPAFRFSGGIGRYRGRENDTPEQ